MAVAIASMTRRNVWRWCIVLTPFERDGATDVAPPPYDGLLRAEPVYSVVQHFYCILATIS